MYKTVKTSAGHLLLDLFRDGIKVGMVMANPYSAQLAIKEAGFKNNCLTQSERIEAQMMSKKTVVV